MGGINYLNTQVKLMESMHHGIFKYMSKLNEVINSNTVLIRREAENFWTYVMR